MLELILVRHGQTESNTRKAYLGHTDIPLDERGERQVIRTAQSFMQEQIDAVYASPLKRALQTAEAINKYHHRKIIPVADLAERNFGIWDNLAYEEILSRYPAEHDDWVRDWANYVIPQGESAAEVYERNMQAIAAILERHKEGTVLVVTHLGCIRNILACLLGLGLDGVFRFEIRNAGICRLEIDEDGFATLLSLNET